MRYDRSRFWCPITESFPLDFDGFLVDPEVGLGRSVMPSIRLLGELSNIPCLVLLGEPGIGKSTVLAGTAEGMERDEGSPTITQSKIDLATIGSEERLIRAVFKTDVAKNWLAGCHHLTLWLDSLDECRLQLAHVAKVLAEQLEVLRPHLARLSIRVACRTVDWPKLLTDRFRDLWGEEKVGFYELLPLRRKDVLAAANTAGVEADAFLQEVCHEEAQSLAMKPITLDFLLRQFREHGSLKGSRKKVYESGCKLLLQETNLSRDSAGQRGELDSAERLLIAEMIAATTIFCSKSAVCIEPAVDLVNGDSLNLPEMRSAFQAVIGEPTYTENQLRETLSTGVFTGQGEHRVGFAHQTYAEFLAASFVAKTTLNLTERLKLVRSADDVTGKIVPQLAETAAWLASYDQEVFNEILRTDPQVLVNSDCTNLHENHKQKLVAELLKLAELGQLLPRDWRQRDRYHTLNHSGIANQMRSVLLDKNRNQEARQLCCEIAEQTCAMELEDDLAAIALDDRVEEQLRYFAAKAVFSRGSEDTRIALKSLALDSTESGPNHDIRALALHNLWPDHISCEELFETLSAPQKKDRGGSYAYFLSHELPRTLETEHLPHALTWVTRRSEAECREYSVGELVATITKQAWANLGSSVVFQAFVEYTLAILDSDRDILPNKGELVEDDELKRRKLLATIVPAIEDFDQQGYKLIFCEPRLARTSDIAWMIERLRGDKSSPLRQHWSKLIERLFDPLELSLVEKVLDACSWCKELREAFAARFNPIRLDSDHAKKLRKQYERNLEWEQERQVLENPPLLDPPPEDRMLKALQASEAGEADGWYDASRNLQHEENRTRYDRDLEVDATKLPGWRIANQVTRQRLLQAAKRFLLECHPHSEDWLGTNSVCVQALSGYRALVLLRKESFSNFEALPESVWSVWAPIIVTYSDYAADQPDKHIHDEIAQACARVAPQTVNDTLRTLIQESKAISTLPQFLDRTWSVQIENCLCKEACESATSPNAVGRLLYSLLEHGSNDGRAIAENLVQNADERHSQRRLEAAKVLLSTEPAASWPKIWKVMLNDNQFGKELMLCHADDHMLNPVLAHKLADRQIAELYIWLENNFPRRTDPKQIDSRVSPRDAIKDYRDATLGVLCHRATDAALASLESIQNALPHLDWMPRVIVDARRKRLQKSWTPLSVDELITLTHKTDQCLVRSASNLREIILESLGTLQSRLQGETPAAIDIWDERSRGVYRPKDEESLSDYVKRHLKQDLESRGIVSMREVMIRRKLGGARGERTDIHITGMVPRVSSEKLDQVQVIVEVKGEWHQEVLTAMKTQLRDRYLEDNIGCHGIYVVGWYKCSQWDTSDSRSGRLKLSSRKELDHKLRSQADRLSSSEQKISSFVLDASLR